MLSIASLAQPLDICRQFIIFFPHFCTAQPSCKYLCLLVSFRKHFLQAHFLPFSELLLVFNEEPRMSAALQMQLHHVCWAVEGGGEKRTWCCPCCWPSLGVCKVPRCWKLTPFLAFEVSHSSGGWEQLSLSPASHSSGRSLGSI